MPAASEVWTNVETLRRVFEFSCEPLIQVFPEVRQPGAEAGGFQKNVAFLWRVDEMVANEIS